MERKPERIGRIINEHFNWEQFMNYVSSEKMELIRSVDTPEELKRHMDFIIDLAGNKFKLTPGIEKILPGLIYYFNGQHEKALEAKMDTCKGLAIIGNFGVGKTILLQLMHDYLRKLSPATPNQFWITSTDAIIESMIAGNYSDSVCFNNTKIGSNNERIKKPIHICLNEFGVQYDIKQYGSSVDDLFDSMLMRRYEIFQQYGKVTHITSNIGLDEWEERFNARLVDRFKEMFNIVVLTGKSFRK
jgi:DNA replication protein DnaC